MKATRTTRLAAALLCAGILFTAGCSGKDKKDDGAAATPPDTYGCLSDAQAAAGSFTIDSGGIPLGAYVQGKGKVGIVLSHRAESSLCEWKDYFDPFTGLGY